MKLNFKIEHFKNSVEIFCDQIERILSVKDVGLSSFILICCLVDSVASYIIRKKHHSEVYKYFIKNYLSKVNSDYANKETCEYIYKGIRCALVHNFTIRKGILLGELDNKKLHLTFDIEGNLIIDLISFYSEVKESIEIYVYKDIKEKPHVQRNFLIHYSNFKPFHIYRSVEIYESGNLELTGHTISPNVNNYEILNYRRN